MQEHIDLPKEYLRFPEPCKRVPRIYRLAHSLAGLALFPVYWIMAYAVRTPGLPFRLLCALKGLRLLLRERDYVRAYGLLVAPLDSVRYFEFDFMWTAVKKIRIQSYLDVSSPRMLPLMITDRDKSVVADLINPDKKDLPETISLAKSFGIAERCRFHNCLIEETPLEPESFDLITSMSVIEHVLDDEGAIQKMWALLKPGGVMLISVPCAAKASEEYTNLNDYELIDSDESGFVFWQRYYDEALIQQRIYSITGHPRRVEIYAEKEAGSYNRNVTQKRSNPYYPYWREPMMMGMQYEFRDQLAELPGMGVIAMEFVKPDRKINPLK
ncbi:class I SAM-dependent methyltransferase [Denitromonas sp.]|uniref:class I SAM-dependent methyltransferase n=1 Tax=Denitromonas sp. TaxID=2734609 RepID=UPI002AFFB221|nr:class I SAM-dependent methyltransferase [Denitromonas sp.]